MAVSAGDQLTHVDGVLDVPHLEPVGIREEKDLPEVRGGELDGVEASPVDLEGRAKRVMSASSWLGQLALY